MRIERIGPERTADMQDVPVELLRGPAIMAGLNRRADQLEDAVRALLDDDRRMLDQNAKDRAMVDQQLHHADFMNKLKGFGHDLGQDMTEHATAPFRAISDVDDYIPKNPGPPIPSSDPDDNAQYEDVVRDSGNNPEMDKAKDWRRSDLEMAGRDLLDDIGTMLFGGSVDKPIPFDDLDFSLDHKDWKCDRWGHDPNNKSTKCKDCGAKLTAQRRYADGADTSGSDSNASSPAPSGGVAPKYDAGSPVPPQFSQGDNPESFNGGGTFTKQFWPGHPYQPTTGWPPSAANGMPGGNDDAQGQPMLGG